VPVLWGRAVFYESLCRAKGNALGLAGSLFGLAW